MGVLCRTAGSALFTLLVPQIEAASDDALHVATGRGSLYTWGIGKQGVLGLGDENDRPSAKAVPVFRGKQVVDVSCGLLHAVAVTVTGEVWSWGGNGQGQCGMGHLELLTTPHVVPALLGRRVHAVACGGAHTVVLTQRGEAWSWGLGGQGQLGHGDHEPRMSPTPITYFTKHGVQACAVSCGMGHSIVLDSTRRKAFAFGWNNQGQLGLGHVNPVATPTAVPVRCAVSNSVLCVCCVYACLTSVCVWACSVSRASAHGCHSARGMWGWPHMHGDGRRSAVHHRRWVVWSAWAWARGDGTETLPACASVAQHASCPRCLRRGIHMYRHSPPSSDDLRPGQRGAAWHLGTGER